MRFCIYFFEILFFKSFWIFVSLFWLFDHDFQILDLGFAIRFSDFLHICIFLNVFSGYLLKCSIFFYCTWTRWSTIRFYILKNKCYICFRFFLLRYTFMYDFVTDIWTYDIHLKKQPWTPINMQKLGNWHLIQYANTRIHLFFLTLSC